MAPSIDDRLTVLLPIPASVAAELGLEFEISSTATLHGANPEDPNERPTLVIDAFSQDLRVVKVAGHGPLLVDLLLHLASEAERAWRRERDRRMLGKERGS